LAHKQYGDALITSVTHRVKMNFDIFYFITEYDVRMDSSVFAYALSPIFKRLDYVDHNSLGHYVVYQAIGERFPSGGGPNDNLISGLWLNYGNLIFIFDLATILLIMSFLYAWFSYRSWGVAKMFVYLTLPLLFYSTQEFLIMLTPIIMSFGVVSVFPSMKRVS
jgi:hypothetical protein